ncbi:MAG TPA: hypothetical protein VIR27_08870 [Mycobacteriales bacterium]
MADKQYDCEVNRGDINMRHLADTLNDRWNDGWALKQIVVQAGNTIIIYERHGSR